MHVVNAASEDPVQAALEMMLGRGEDFASKATAPSKTNEQAVDMFSSAGTAVVVGQAPEEVRISLDPFRYPIVKCGGDVCGSSARPWLVRPADRLSRILDLYLRRVSSTSIR